MKKDPPPMIYGPVLSSKRRRGAGKSWCIRKRVTWEEVGGWELGTLASLGNQCKMDRKRRGKLGVRQREVVCRNSPDVWAFEGSVCMCVGDIGKSIL